MKILITGGAGFIGSHLVRFLVTNYPSYHIYNVDALTYAGNLENLKDIENAPNYTFVHLNICDTDALDGLFSKYHFDKVVHLAAESHVDRSITNPTAFVETNVTGTVNLLNACLSQWQGAFNHKLFYHISTDEVYGSLGSSGYFTETTKYAPNSPYSASKASSDHFVRAYGETYGIPYIISNCSNNYGPNQFPEKLIPLFIHNCLNDKPLPVYGAGANVRDWLFVQDHVNAIDTLMHHGSLNETYVIGGKNEWKNIDLVTLLCDLVDDALSRKRGTSQALITFVTDRQGHDLRYAIDPSKIEQELNWTPSVTFKDGLKKTIEWYLTNPDWLNQVTSGAYRDYYKKQYLQ